MPSSNPTPTHDSPLQTESNEPLHPPILENTQPPETDSVLAENEEPNDEEESECGFCLFMKAGGCRDTFIRWEKCVDEGESNKEDIVQKCHAVTKALKDCMEAHPDHYGPILQAEKAAEQQLEKEMEMEKEGNVETKELGLVADSVQNIQVEEVPNATDSDQKLAV